MIAALQLWAPDSYEDATQEQIAARCNGAGPRGYGWLVPDRIYGVKITAAANIHDWQYGEARCNDDRLLADLTFLRNMIVLIMQEDVDASWFERRLTFPRLCRSLKYFIVVWRLGGRFAGDDSSSSSD